jgi:hypothetical protein
MSANNELNAFIYLQGVTLLPGKNSQVVTDFVVLDETPFEHQLDAGHSTHHDSASPRSIVNDVSHDAMSKHDFVSFELFVACRLPR